MNGTTFAVKLKATGQLRIATVLANSGTVGTDYVGAYDPNAADPWITIGEVHIEHANAVTGENASDEAITYTYKSVYGHAGAADAFNDSGLSFVYSASPKSTSADSESTSESYGTFVVDIVA